jgi:hypothetical protein
MAGALRTDGSEEEDVTEEKSENKLPPVEEFDATGAKFRLKFSCDLRADLRLISSSISLALRLGRTFSLDDLLLT